MNNRDLSNRWSRHTLLATVSAIIVGIFGGLTGVVVYANFHTTPVSVQKLQGLQDSETLLNSKHSFYGAHQSGIVTPITPYVYVIGMDLKERARDRDHIESLLRLYSEDASMLMAGLPVLGTDPAPMIASSTASLTTTISFGEKFFEYAKITKPKFLTKVPAMKNIDNLDNVWSQTDFVIQISSADQLVLTHAARNFTHDLSTLADVKWVQSGFRGSSAPLNIGESHRTLMGWMEGIDTPDPKDYEKVIWTDSDVSWEKGGTYLGIRRIRFDMDTWEALDLNAQELVIGRTRDDSIPLSGKAASDKPDFTKVDQNGLTLIPDNAHIKVVNAESPERNILRRTYNYFAGKIGSKDDAGLVFMAYTSNPTKSYIPMLSRIDKGDSLNKWNTHIGSAIYFTLPGAKKGKFIGEEMLLNEN